MSRASKSIYTCRRLMVSKGWGKEEGRVTTDGDGVSLWSNENILELND